MAGSDTICAVSTPSGQGAIAIIRLSGEKALDIAVSMFRPADKGSREQEYGANTMHYGLIREAGEVIDEVVMGVFRAPHSYTGEDVVEFSCHGSVYIQQRVLQMCISNGARL
ncbi:MAG: tRNA uridine-5-carboxymethylaminomethyl(34) synthesis GTPase MnmE, partial [Bacteroidetes bacterium]|nr:tRNA uridine-5-carboxymethylaminomethyl(34) synthesis GTPase MnmE [Bacteroidota bacterium]